MTIRRRTMVWIGLVALMPYCRADAQDGAEPWVHGVHKPQYFAVQVRDVDRAVAWYAQAFGLEVLDDARADDDSWRIVNLGSDALSIEIIRDRGAQQVERARGFLKVGFRISNVEDVAERIERSGVERPRIVDVARHGVRILQLRDPEGNIVQLSSPIGFPSTRIAITDRFEFHSDPWINLHHFLYQWARLEEGFGTGRHFVPVPERESLDDLGEDDRSMWIKAVAFYRDSVAGRDHFDRDMLLVKRDLRKLGGDPEAMLPDHIPGIARALANAMPVYGTTWWPIHDAENRDWVANVRGLVRKYEAEYVRTTIRIFGAEWPEDPIRIDVSAYANWAAGYTATGHTVIYSTDPGNRGLYALETLFHEVLHTRAIGGPGRKALYATFEGAGVEVPDNLWHALIFQTAGQFVQSVAKATGSSPHTPYWTREKFETFGGWRSAVKLAREHWGPVVSGEASSEQGYQALLDAVQASMDDR